jgi:EAL domain-containing protein (putative c-di-GMP-specific phosphodiesterase class I)
MSVVAEGIENQQILDMLVRMGCDYGQGYYFSKPVSAEEMAAMIEDADIDILHLRDD